MVTLDIAILGLFLLVTLAVGMSHGRQVKSIKDYALGGKNFSTITLAATVIATWISGSGMFIDIENTYTQGLYYLIAALGGLPLGLWLSGQLACGCGSSCTMCQWLKPWAASMAALYKSLQPAAAS